MLYLAVAIAVVAISAAGIVFLATDADALVRRPETISPTAIADAKRLFRLNDPRQLRGGQTRKVSIPVALVDTGSNHLATRFGNGRASFTVTDTTAALRVSLPLKISAVSRHVNLEAVLSAANGSMALSTLRVGRLTIPPHLVVPALDVAARLWGHEQDWRLVQGAIDRVVIAPRGRHLDLVYTWQPELLSRFRTLALPEAGRPHLEAAQRNLAALLGFRARDRELALGEILQPMLRTDGDDALEQRRAALLVLASYLAGRNLATAIPEAAAWPRPPYRVITLQQREDSAQHFIVSAALSAWAGEPVADAIGLYKELDDARGSSGFSFADLAADRAGTRFGKLLADHPQRIDSLLSAPLADADLLPPLSGLPEFIPEAEFRRRFGTMDSPAYRDLIDEVERRIDTRPLYRPGP
ncbi:hypothetical protein J5J83_03470 [Azoarcus sp. L1K30]|uniref:hypothetical protein n=1 Tax=Azoarcus sp. L1K30 TaxID=2820277 RepID=UPI001B82DD0C|nr:hypothetical protein [Azoarcus sp. L1K30]MBR0565175.1 hypothetical protein [Azoarcus sp. L1K30]